MKTLIIGDIHGCLDKLEALIAKAGTVDEIISVGDLIDRGPDSMEVIKYCLKNNIKVCKGNHELMAQQCLEKYNPSKPFSNMWLLGSDWFYNGGDKVYGSCTPQDLSTLLLFVKSLPLYIKTSHVINDLPVVVSHTCLNSLYYSLLDMSQEDLNKYETQLLWYRGQTTQAQPKFFSVYGHTPTDALGVKTVTPIITDFGVNLDTGACYSSETRGKLTGIILPTMEIIQV